MNVRGSFYRAERLSRGKEIQLGLQGVDVRTASGYVTGPESCRHVTEPGSCRYVTEPGSCRYVTEPGSCRYVT